MIDVPGSSRLTFSGYYLHENLYESATSRVYRAQRAADKQPVILKILKQAYPSPEKIAWFKREYDITRAMNLAGVLKAYGLENRQQHWLMVLEDFGGESLERLSLAGKLPLSNFLSLAIEVTDILGRIHERQIIHKDISPANIVVVPPSAAEKWQAKVIDFGISTALSRENPTFRSPTVLEGTLAYMSPEQTGRMNRALDYRTDFYSLGATFYELLTGQAPFPTGDPLALIHHHLAIPPLPPQALKPDLPPSLGEIIFKLMAKNAEDRYQSAAGLKADLVECLGQWQSRQRIEDFPLGQQDSANRLQIPQRLYGREAEVNTFLAAFERVGVIDPAKLAGEASGQALRSGSPGSPGVEYSRNEMMLVSGAAGIGKTALVHEVYPPLTRRRGYFIAGKFDQLQANTPYAAFIQAFRALIRQLLTESDAEVAAWREKLLAALGHNGRVLLEVIPELELIIGSQPAVPTLPPTESLNRFNLTFQQFSQVFTRPEHPLVIFLDDLQWADGASLQLLELLMTPGMDNRALFLIGAYRDNEVGPAHPLRLMVTRIEQSGAAVQRIFLTALALPHIRQLLADTLRCSADRASSLADLTLAKTGGNPFFLNEFLKSLYADNLLRPEGENPASGWQWNLRQIQRRGLTDNVVELLTGKLQQLPPETQTPLKLAACLGNQFDLTTLALVSGQSPGETAMALWPALQAELILPLSDAYKIDLTDFETLSGLVSYKFAHDRIQQAAYSLISEANRPTIHRHIGGLLLEYASLDEREQTEHIFDIVNQLNRGRILIDRQAERDELAGLNLIAGRRAKTSAAYQPALTYLRVGLALLAPLQRVSPEAADTASWQRQYDLTLNLHLEAAEAALLNGHFDEMEQLAEVVLQQTKSLLDSMKIYELKVQAGIMRNEFQAAVMMARRALSLLGHELPEQPSQVDIIMGLQETQGLLAGLPAPGGKQVEAFGNLPDMTDPEQLAALRLLSGVAPAAFIGMPELYPLIVFKLIKLSIQYGLATESAFACSNYAVIMCGIVGDIEAGYDFGQLAVRLLDRFKITKVKARTFYLLNCHIRHWKEPLRDAAKGLAEAYQIGLETGDFETAGFAALAYPFYGYFSGKGLNEVEQEMVNYGQAIDQIKQETASRYNTIWRQVISNLLGRAEDPCRLVGENYDEEKMVPLHLKTNDRNALVKVYINKLILCYLLGQVEQALDHATQAEIYLDSAIASIGVPIVNFYGSLARLARYPFAAAAEKEELLNKVTASQEKMKQWAHHAPMNHLHKYWLVEAERARVLAQIGPAIEYYQQAIAAAGQNGYSQEEALGCELAARFYLARGMKKAAQTYMIEAYYGYHNWGAQAKTDHLVATYPQLLAPILLAPQPEPGLAELQAGRVPSTMTQSHPAERLDLVTLLKATQAITAKTGLADLLETLLRIVMQNAGARRGCLLLPRAGQATASQTPAEAWLIEAEATVQPDQVTVLQGIPLKPWPVTALPLSLINYVTRTQEAVVLDDRVGRTPFAHDPYLLARRPQSALCLPLVSQGRLKGLLYLENRLVQGVFTPERLELLKHLAAPAAIALENALLAAPPAPATPRSLADMPPSFFIPATGQTLTRREIEILALLAAGATNRAIAMQLIISRDTVKTHLKNIFAKLGVTSRQQAIAHARELGLL
jgi:predicted ATPase/GAF domain-containing protein/DNA-binding CsgD family transcriptional regulator/tRNA A-37 threonylcarbamoyl transferase component Bud32